MARQPVDSTHGTMIGSDWSSKYINEENKHPLASTTPRIMLDNACLLIFYYNRDPLAESCLCSSSPRLNYASSIVRVMLGWPNPRDAGNMVVCATVEKSVLDPPSVKKTS
jgi:hypothetical protein